MLTVIDGIIEALGRSVPAERALGRKFNRPHHMSVRDRRLNWETISTPDGLETTYECVSYSGLLDLSRYHTIEKNHLPLEWDYISGVYKVLSKTFKDSLFLARAELEVLFDAVPKLLDFSLSDQASFLFEVLKWNQSNFITFAKYHTAWPMAKYLSYKGNKSDSSGELNPVPPTPPGFIGSPLVWRGAVKRVLKSRLVSKTKSNTKLFWSMLQGIKRGTAVVPDVYVLGALADHISILTQLPPRSREDVELEFIPYLDRFFIESGWREQLSTVSLFDASQSASFENSRSRGGGRSLIRGDFNDRTDMSSQLELSKEVTNPLGVTSYVPLLDLNGDVRTSSFSTRSLHPEPLFNMVVKSSVAGNVASNFGGVKPSLDFVENALIDSGNISFEILYWMELPEDLLNVINEFLGRETLESSVFPFITASAEVESVLEPLKVRNITKTHAYASYYARFYQRELWRNNALLPQFALTKEVVQTFHFDEIILQEEKLGILDFDLWVSGDYKSATDLLIIFFTKVALERSFVSKGLSSFTKAILRSLLYEHKIYYHDKDEELTGFITENRPELLKFLEYDMARPNGVFVQQKNGQLMGSVLSFPILCIANLLCYWEALEVYLQSSVALVDLPVKINGDDILFRTNERFYAIWRDKIGGVGFKLSVGKNYVHPSLFTINSVLHSYSSAVVKGKKVHRFERLDFLSVDLLIYGKMETRKDIVLPLWDAYDMTIRGAQDQYRTHRRFIHYNRKMIEKFTGNGKSFNLFFARELGGLGFTLTPDVRHGIEKSRHSKNFSTQYQRMFSYFLFEGYKKYYLPNKVGWAKEVLHGLKFVKPISKGSYVTEHPGSVLVQLVPKLHPLFPNWVYSLPETVSPDFFFEGDFVFVAEQKLVYKPITYKIRHKFNQLLKSGVHMPEATEEQSLYYRYNQVHQFTSGFVDRYKESFVSPLSLSSMHQMDVDVLPNYILNSTFRGSSSLSKNVSWSSPVDMTF